MLIDELASPLAAATGWKKLVAHELLLWLAFQLMNGDVDCAATAIQHHDDRVPSHLIPQTLFCVISALD